jgi:hypothetical protein
VPFRCYDPELQQEPFVYRLIEAINHYGDGLKLLANEKCGDGIISAIDFYVTMDQVSVKCIYQPSSKLSIVCKREVKEVTETVFRVMKKVVGNNDQNDGLVESLHSSLLL